MAQGQWLERMSDSATHSPKGRAFGMYTFDCAVGRIGRSRWPFCAVRGQLPSLNGTRRLECLRPMRHHEVYSHGHGHRSQRRTLHRPHTDRCRLASSMICCIFLRFSLCSSSCACFAQLGSQISNQSTRLQLSTVSGNRGLSLNQATVLCGQLSCTQF
jgi:hypothetical protein